MELTELALLGFVILGIFVIVYQKYVKNEQKATKSNKKQQTETLESQIKGLAGEQLREFQSIYQQKIEILQTSIMELKKENISLNRALARYKGIDKQNQSNTEEDEDTESVSKLMAEYEIDPQKAIQYTQKLGLNPQALSNPALTTILWEKLLENKDMALMLGIIRPKGMAQQNSFTSIPADSTQALFAELQKTGNFA